MPFRLSVCEMIDVRFALGLFAMSHSVDSNASEQIGVMPVSKVYFEQCLSKVQPGTHNENMKS